jgi:hypothetical protein
MHNHHCLYYTVFTVMQRAAPADRRNTMATITINDDDRDVLLYSVHRTIESIREFARIEPEAFAMFTSESEKLDRLVSLASMLYATRVAHK